jgi:ribosome-associated protein
MQENSLLIAQVAAKAADAKKARDINVIDITKLTTFTDYFVICSGGSEAQLEAIADEVKEKLGKAGIPTRRQEGTPASQWILIDFGSVVVHIFHEYQRKFYDLDRVWADGERISLDM